MNEVTLPRVLAARDARALRQQELLRQGKPLLCFTMNIEVQSMHRTINLSILQHTFCTITKR